MDSDNKTFSIMLRPGFHKFYPALVIAASVLAACSKYQYVSLSGALPRNNLNEYVVDNDTVSLRYSFKRQGIAATVSVENKLRQPLYIDYQRSVVVVNNEQGTGPFFLDNQPSFIAPLSKVVVHNVAVRMSCIKMPEETRPDEVRIGSGKGRKYTFDEKSTPLHLRHILAITPYEDYSYPTFHDYSFWIANVTESHSGPKSAGVGTGNISYLYDAKGQANLVFWSVVIGACMVPVVIGLAVAGG